MTGTWKQLEGQVVNGEFYLREYLGGTDHSAVFLTELGLPGARRAAIKLIPADSANAELYLSRLMRAAKLSHPHLMKLYQVGRCQLGPRKQLYIVMEYAEEELSQILPERPLTPTEARQMLEPVLDVLAYLHGEGFVHGHIKPANILVVDDQIRISCDGLYPLNDPSGVLEKAGSYDPPEASSGKVSPAWDVWALGITLAEALTQHIPIREKTEQGATVVSETLPPPFLDLISHCLHPDPQRRSTLADIAMRLKPPSPSLPIQASTSTGSTGNRGEAALDCSLGGGCPGTHRDIGDLKSPSPPSHLAVSPFISHRRARGSTKSRAEHRVPRNGTVCEETSRCNGEFRSYRFAAWLPSVRIGTP